MANEEISPYQKLAIDTIDTLKKTEGVDGVFLMIVSKSKDSMGASMDCSNIHVDTMIGAAVAVLGNIRQQVVNKADTEQQERH